MDAAQLHSGAGDGEQIRLSFPELLTVFLVSPHFEFFLCGG